MSPVSDGCFCNFEDQISQSLLLINDRYPKRSTRNLQSFLRKKNNLVLKVFFVSLAFFIVRFGVLFLRLAGYPSV